MSDFNLELMKIQTDQDLINVAVRTIHDTAVAEEDTLTLSRMNNKYNLYYLQQILGINIEESDESTQEGEQ